MRGELTSRILITLFVLVIVISSCTPKTKQADMTEAEDQSVETVEETVVTEETAVTEVTVVTEEGTVPIEENGNYEPFPVLKASEILPPELLKSEYHEVSENI